MESNIIVAELPPFVIGERIPLKGVWFTVSKVGLTEGAVPGMVLQVSGLTAKEKERRERKEKKLGKFATDGGVASTTEGVAGEEGDNRSAVEGASPTSDRPRESETETGPVASSDNSNEGQPNLEQSSAGGDSDSPA